MELTEEISIDPELGSKYSELVGSVQEYDETLNEYRDAVDNYETTITNFKNGTASPAEMREAMDQVIYADEQVIETAVDVEMSVSELKTEYAFKGGEDSVVPMTTEHTLAAQKIEETTDNFRSTDYNFIDSLNELEEIETMTETTVELMERDEDFLERTLDYSWEDAEEKVSDYDTEKIDELMEGFALSARRNEVIQESPNDRYLGGFASDTGTEDLQGKREEVLGPDSELQEKIEEVLGVDGDDLEEARNRVQERKPRYLQ